MDGITDVEVEVEEVEEATIEEQEDDGGDGDSAVVVEQAPFTTNAIKEFAEMVSMDVALFTGAFNSLSELNAIVVAERARKTSVQNSSVAPQAVIQEADTEVEVSETEKEAAFAEAITAINAQYGG